MSDSDTTTEEKVPGVDPDLKPLTPADGEVEHGEVRPREVRVFCGDCQGWVSFDPTSRDARTAINGHRLPERQLCKGTLTKPTDEAMYRDA